MLAALDMCVTLVSAPCARSVSLRRLQALSGAVARRSQGLVEEWSAFRVYGGIVFLDLVLDLAGFLRRGGVLTVCSIY